MRAPLALLVALVSLGSSVAGATSPPTVDDADVTDASVAVLGAVLPTLLDTLAGQRGASAPPAGTEPPGTAVSDGTAVGGARAGLAGLLASVADTPDAAPLEACRLADAAAVDAALETAGVDAPLGGWGQWVGRVAPLDQFPQRGVVCEGAHIGATGDSSFPELLLALAAVDFTDAATLDAYLADYLGVGADEESMSTGDAGGSTTGRCVQRDRVYDCYEVWTDGSGLAVMLHVQDRTYFDRPTASAVLDELVPGVLASLGSGSVGDDGPFAAVSDDAVAAAADGLTALAAGGDEAAACALLGRPELDTATADAEVVVAVDAWTGAPADDRPGFPAASYVCTSVPEGGGDGLTLFAGQFTSAGEAADFVASLALADGGTADDLDPADPTPGSCVQVAGAEFCVEMWQRGTLVVGVTLSGQADEIGRGDAAALLAAVGPEVIATLAERGR